MATVKTAIQIIDNASRPMARITNSVSRSVSAFEQVDQTMRITGNTMSEVKSKVTSYAHELKKTQNMDFGDAMRQAWAAVDRETKAAIGCQQQYNNELKQTSGLTGLLKNAFLGMGAAYTAKKVIDLADAFTSTKARLDLINDGLQSTEALQQKIFDSANRSRAFYQSTVDIVSKLGVLAGSAFSSNDEMIKFTELMNKNFVIGGASVQEQTSAMYQLTQAMAAGKLQGDEFRSIMENAPLLAQAIADYMGKPMGELKQLGAEGQITSDIIKNALFSSADQIEERFSRMPMTFAQVWTTISNGLLLAFQPIIQAIGAAAQWIYDNWSILAPIFVGLAAAIAVYAIAIGICTVVTAFATGAAQAFFAALISNPIMWIALAIGVLVGFIYKWIQSVGGIKVAWLIVCNAILTAWSAVKIGFMTGVYYVQNLFDQLKFKLLTIGASIAIYMGDQKVAVLTILQSMVNGAIGIINSFIALLNKIPGVSIEAIGEVTFATTAAAENAARKQAITNSVNAYGDQLEAAAAERDSNLNSMKSSAAAEAAARQVEIGAAQSSAAANAAANDTAASAAASSAETAGNTGKMADSMDLAEEELKYLRDIAEQEIINRFTTAEVVVQFGGITNQVNSEVDLDGIADYIATKTEEALLVAAEGVH